MMVPYSLDDAMRSYGWLGHRNGYTELSAISSVDGRRRVVIDYVTSAAGVRQFVETNAGALLLVGLNPRPTILTRPDGRLRAALNVDIAIAQNALWDFDCPSGNRSKLLPFLDSLEGYWRELGIEPPVRADSGNGMHLLFAFPPVAVAEHPAIAGQLQTFHHDFGRRYRQALDAISVTADNVFDLRRCTKVYGTRKTPSGPLSTFPDVRRNEDERLREYLLQLPARPPTTAVVFDESIRPGTDLPAWFHELLRDDVVIRNLWEGIGKTSGDTSRSGYDYSLARELVRRGHEDRDELAAILLRRSGGAADTKGLGYVARTILHALK